MKNIIILTSFSQSALKAIPYVVRLFPGDSCRLTLLHTIKTPDSIPDLLLMPREEERLEAVDNSFSRILEKLKKSYAVELLEVQIVHAYGDVSTGIEQLAQDQPIDMIICPEEDIDGDLGALRRLLDKIVYPVLYIPFGCETARPKKIAYFQEKDFDDSIKLADTFYELMQSYQTQLLVLSVFRPKERTDFSAVIDSFRKHHQQYPEIDYSFHLMSGEDPLQGVAGFLQDYKVDMMVMKRTRKHFFQWFAGPNHLEEMIPQARIPFLTI